VIATYGPPDGLPTLLIVGGITDHQEAPATVALANALAERGCRVAVPAYRRSSIRAGLADLRAACETLADWGPLACLGTSLGANRAIRLAAEGRFVRLAVCSPPISPTLQRITPLAKGRVQAPLRYLTAAFPPTAIWASDSDPIVGPNHSKALAARLTRLGGHPLLTLAAGGKHGPRLGLDYAEAISGFLRGAG